MVWQTLRGHWKLAPVLAPESLLGSSGHHKILDLPLILDTNFREGHCMVRGMKAK